MSYKTRMCYVILREQWHDPDQLDKEIVPVAVFFDEETAYGNAEGYNLEFQEREIEGIRFVVAVTAAYE